MRFETAIYGEVEGGHALRSVSANGDFARSISGRFDIPSTPASGVSWSPSLSGFPAHDHYVVGRTFLDRTAPRGNMVVAHALFAPLGQMRTFSSLSRVIARLASVAEQIPAAAAIEVEDGPDDIQPAAHSELAALLIARPQKPVVILDDREVDKVVAGLWSWLWPSMRAGFAFRLSFSPEDIFESPLPALVHTPASLAARWKGYPILGQTSVAETTASRVLSGAEGADPVAAFAEAIGYHAPSLAHFAHLVDAQSLTCGEQTTGSLGAAMRLVNLLSPDPGEGRNAKADLVDRMASAVVGAGPTEIMAMRNFDLQGFEDLAPLWRAVEDRMASNGVEPADLTEELPVICAGGDERQAVAEWRRAVEAGSRALAASRPAAFAAAVWEDQNLEGAPLGYLVDLMTAERAETLLIEAMPTALSKGVSAMLTEWSTRGWLTLHGATLAASSDAANAVRAQLKIDEDPTFDAGLRAALGRAAPAEVIDIALDHADPRLDALAGTSLAADRRLGVQLEPSQIPSQRIWAAALATDPSAWQAPVDPQAARDVVFDMLVDGGKVFGPLLDALAGTPLADLSDHPRRLEILSIPDLRPEFIEATAAGWLDRAAGGQISTLDLNLEKSVLASPRLEGVLTQGWGAALQIIAQLHTLDESRAVSWAEVQLRRSDRLGHQHAVLLGNIVLARGWSSLLSLISRQAGRHPELREALRVCSRMLSPMTRWFMGITDLGPDEKWNAFGDLAAQLYPTGPRDWDIWERAGGHPSHLRLSATGADSWRDALRQMRRGAGPNPRRLIDEMQKDFRNNADLRFVAQDRDIIK